MHIPKPGDHLSTPDVEMIVEAVKKRQENFPGEPSILSMSLVMLNIGDRFRPLTCIEEEWTGMLHDLPSSEPVCPNGHPINRGAALRLVWVPEDYIWEEDEDETRTN